MNAIDFFSSPVAYSLGWTLLHAIWQGFAIVLPIALVLHLFRNKPSALRYRISVLSLLGQLLASAAIFMWYYKPTPVISDYTVTTTIRPAVSIHWQTMAQTLPWHEQLQQFFENHISQFVLAYLIGILVFGLRLIGGLIYLERLSRAAIQPATTIWSELSDQLRSSLAIRTAIQVKESAQITVPMVMGVIKPVVLIPVSLATNLSMREIEAVLAHELAHVKRYDYGVNLLQSVVEVLYFFHPAIWWLSARVREEREHCCDDLAVQACGGDGRILAQALAHVEELRLTHIQTPTLAMAFASKRQQLLHRVRRILGVPTQSFVSNGSLAGLTLATLLLLSASVYAVQQQAPQPKPKTSQQTTRRHKAGNGTEYGMTDKQKVSYIVWKGQKLPAARVTQLQQQLDQVMAGQLSLDAVKQPDRDILLTIIETNVGFDAGMKALSEGMAHIAYNNIVTSTLNTIPVNLNKTVEELAKVDYSAVINDALVAVDTNIFFNDQGIVKSGNAEVVNHFRQGQLDSLSQLMAKHSQQMEAIRLQMEKLQFPVEESERNRDVLEWKKNKIVEKRSNLLEKHRQLLYSDSKQKLSQVEVEKQLEALEPEIKKQEVSIEELNKQIEVIEQKIKENQEPLAKLQRQAEELDRQMSRYSDQLSREDENLRDLDIRLNVTRPVAPRAPARTRRLPRPAKAPNAILPPTPAAPAVAPAPVVTPSRVTPAPRVVAPDAPTPPPAPDAVSPKVKKRR